MQLLRISSHSQPSSVAGNVSKLIREKQHAELQALDAGAVNQSVKAIVLAKLSLEKQGIQIAFKPFFVDVESDQGVKEGIRFIIEPRK